LRFCTATAAAAAAQNRKTDASACGGWQSPHLIEQHLMERPRPRGHNGKTPKLKIYQPGYLLIAHEAKQTTKQGDKKMKLLKKFREKLEAFLDDYEKPVLTEEEKQKERIRKACMLGASGVVKFETKEEQAKSEENRKMRDEN
jgi:hypothetical protein